MEDNLFPGKATNALFLRMLKTVRFLTLPTLARRDAPLPMVRSHLGDILNVALRERAASQLGVGE